MHPKSSLNGCHRPSFVLVCIACLLASTSIHAVSAKSSNGLDLTSNSSHGPECQSATTKCNVFLDAVRMSFPESFQQALDFHKKLDGQWAGYAKWLLEGRLGDDDVPDVIVGFTLGCCLFAGPCHGSFKHSKKAIKEDPKSTPEVQQAWVIGSFMQSSMADIEDEGESASLAVDMTLCLSDLIQEDLCGEKLAGFMRRQVELGGDTIIGNKARVDLGTLYLRRFAGRKYTDPSEGYVCGKHLKQGDPDDAKTSREYLRPLLKSSDKDVKEQGRHLLQLVDQVEHMWNRKAPKMDKDEEVEEEKETISESFTESNEQYNDDADEETSQFTVLLVAAIAFIVCGNIGYIWYNSTDESAGKSKHKKQQKKRK